MNQFLVAAHGPEHVKVLRPPAPRQLLTNDKALNLAVWLAVLADPTGENFRAVLAAVKGT